METLLKVEGINVYYGAIHAIKDISFQVNQGGDRRRRCLARPRKDIAL